MKLTRGCGNRKCGGLYLVGEGIPVLCKKLPVEVPAVCSYCNGGIKQSRGITFINPSILHIEQGHCGAAYCTECPVGVMLPDRVGLMWVGKKYYTPQSFTDEASRFGVSKRIAQIPKELVLGETWILLTHPEGMQKTVDCEKCTCKPTLLIKHDEARPAVFHAFRPERIETPLSKEVYLDESGKVHEEKEIEIRNLLNRGIAPVFVDVDGKGDAVEDTEIMLLISANSALPKESHLPSPMVMKHHSIVRDAEAA